MFNYPSMYFYILYIVVVSGDIVFNEYHLMYERIASQNQPLPKDRCDDKTFILLGRVSKYINSLKNNE